MRKRYCCDWCRRGIERRDFRNGAVDVEDFEDVEYKPRKRKRSSKVCAKSKTGEPCDQKGTKVKGTKRKYDPRTREFTETVPNIISCCSRCGREHWWAW